MAELRWLKNGPFCHFWAKIQDFFSNFGPQLAHLLEDLFGQTVWLKPMASRFQWYQIWENPGTGSPGYSTGKIGQFWPKINIFQFFKVGTFFINFCQNWPILDLFWLWLHIFCGCILWMWLPTFLLRGWFRKKIHAGGVFPTHSFGARKLKLGM